MVHGTEFALQSTLLVITLQDHKILNLQSVKKHRLSRWNMGHPGFPKQIADKDM